MSIKTKYKWDSVQQKMVLEQDYRKPITEADFLYIKTDEIEPCQSMATVDSPTFTSLARLREYDKDHGFIHCGPEGIKREQPKLKVTTEEEVRETAAKCLNDLRWGNVPVDERSKELWNQEERAYKAWKQRNWKH